MKNVKNTPKNKSGKFKRFFESKKDIQYTKTLETIGFSISEEFYKSVQYNEAIFDNSISKLEEIITKIDHFGNDKKRILEIIEELEIYSKEIFVKYEKKIKSSKDKKVKEKIDAIVAKINKTIAEMKEIVEEYDDISPIKIFVLDKCLSMSSDLGENKQNLGEDFSYLKDAIEEHYGKRERRFNRAVAIGAATVTAGIGIGTTVSIVENKIDEIKEPLIEIYGSEENIPDSVYSQFFTETGMPKPGAEEKMKQIILSKALKNIINQQLGETTDQIFVESLNLNFGKKEKKFGESKDNLEELQIDGYSITFKTNIGEVVKIENYQTCLTGEGKKQITGDNEAPQIRKWLENLTIEESMNILKGDSEEREMFIENLGIPILEINNKVLQELVKSEEREAKSIQDNNDDEIMK